tara:strand:- start:3074 stop:3397 length:324 start_codon:yes stop_codon:yes gene_type:complete
MTTSEFASGKYALGECDRCGFTYQLTELSAEFEDKKPNGLRVCQPCLDPDHPQLQLGRFRIYDPQSLRDPRPDLGEGASTALFGWNPVGDESLLAATGKTGTVTVTT